MEMHLIQKHVLKQLAKSKKLRYSELKPTRVEGNQFSYHLKTLVRLGYIRHSDHGYSLTTKGVHYTTGVNLEHFFVRAQPKVVTLIVCENSAEEYLVYTRGKEPFLGMIGFPYGKVHLGEPVEGAASREIQEKTGYHAELVQKGIVYTLVTDSKEEVVVHMLCHIFYGKNPVALSGVQPALDTMRWLTKEQLVSEACMPGVADVLRIALSKKQPGLQFEELSFQQL